MLLQSTIQQYPLHHHHHHRRRSRRVYLTSTLSSFLSFPSGCGISTFYRTVTAHKNAIAWCSISQVHSYGTVDNKKRHPAYWVGLYKSISLMKDPKVGAASVLNQCEKERKTLTKWEVLRVIKELRKFGHCKLALEVYEWMKTRAERFVITTSDTTIQLDLIAKVCGTLHAEDYFLKLPERSKDKRTYGTLLNAYAQAKMREKAESLFEKMKIKGYLQQSLQFSTMMTLYLKLKEYDKVDLLVSEMKQKNIPLDLFSYNIWLSSCGGQGSVEKMEQVFEQMKLESFVNPNWTTFGLMASVYIRLGQLGKAEDCLKYFESKISGQDRIPYHHLISLYGSVGKREEVYRVWNICKSLRGSIPVRGYQTMISSLARLGDIEGAEQLYAEWLSVNPTNDHRIVNVLMGFYSRNGLLEKAEAFLDRMVESGGKPSSVTWEILAEGHVREKRVSEALSCLKKAVSISRSNKWRPRPVNVASILSICMQNDDMQSKEVLMGLLRQLGCLKDENYMSDILSANGVATAGDEDDTLLN